MAEILTESQLRQARRLIRGLCANYDNGRCLILDSLCPQYVSYTLLCNYFREAVLPDKECQALQAEILKAPSVRRCVICGKPLQTKSNRAKYCSKCAENIRRQKTVDYVRRHRQNKDRNVSI